MFGSVLASQAKVTWAAWTFEGGGEKRIKAAKKKKVENPEMLFHGNKEINFSKAYMQPHKDHAH